MVGVSGSPLEGGHTYGAFPPTHMDSWQSLVYCNCLESSRAEMLRGFKSYTILQSQDTLGYALVSPNGLLKGLPFGWHISYILGNSPRDTHDFSS